ncbi:MAG: hypothetical protein IJZ46_06340 [Bacilli bacterium]|nr:hypothetical protein [Bacilli bacterium]
MKEIPEMISPKDLLYLEDMFNWNFIMAKKAYQHSLEVTDKDIEKHLNEVYKTHKKICEKIIKLIEKEV